CVGSGKGGVGKSTLTANLAAALSAEGRRAGVLDADVWGYSIPRMFGLGATRPPVSAQRKIVPLEAHGVRVMSIGFFVEEDAAVVWRGPMLHKALTQFLQDVEWGELDHLLIDLPPGTGDVSMTLAQLLPQARFVIVTTPQPTAQRVARRAAEMAHKVSLEVAGVIENMSGFTTPAGERYAIFGEGGGQELADELDVPLLGKVPLTMPLREHADSGVPLVLEDPDDPAAQAIRQAARGLIAMAPVKLPVLEAPLAPAAPGTGNGAGNGASSPAPTPPTGPKPAGMSLPMA
ncbi:MAG: Mrp/NBP35 family ATP-binding protein, partial [Solirubrobacterales bacterium]